MVTDKRKSCFCRDNCLCTATNRSNSSIHINKNESVLPQHAEFGYVTGKSEKILELIMPFKGKIVRTNIDLLKDTRRINTAPYMAWIVYFKITDKEGVKDLIRL